MRQLIICLLLYCSFAANAAADSLLLTGQITAARSQILAIPFHQSQGFNRQITLLLPEGTLVEKGDTVAMLNSESITDRIESLQDQFDTQQENNLTAINTDELDFVSAKRAIHIAELELEKAQLNERSQTQYSSKKEIADAVFDREKAEAELEKAERSYAVTEQQNKAKLEARELELELIKHQLERAERELAESTLTAHQAGMVIAEQSITMDNKYSEGDSLQTGTIFASILPIDNTELRAYVNEVDLNRVQVNDQVSVVFDRYPAKRFSSSIRSIGSAGNRSVMDGEGVWFPVLVALPKLDDLLFSPGMSARIEVAE